MPRAQPRKDYIPRFIALHLHLDEDTKDDLLQILEIEDYHPKRKQKVIKEVEKILTLFPEFLRLELNKPTPSQLTSEITRLQTTVSILRKELVHLSPMAKREIIAARIEQKVRLGKITRKDVTEQLYRREEELRAFSSSLFRLLVDLGTAKQFLSPTSHRGRRKRGKSFSQAVFRLANIFERYRRKRGVVANNIANSQIDFVKTALKSLKLSTHKLPLSKKSINAALRQYSPNSHNP